MKLPAYFELNGQYAVMLPLPNGGVEIIKDPGSPNIADFMQDGSNIPREKLPPSWDQSLKEALSRNAAS